MTEQLEISQEKQFEIKLKEFSLDDAEDYFELINDNREYFANFNNLDVNKYQSVEETASIFKGSEGGGRTRYGIYNKADKLIGAINITIIDEDIVKIGYLVAQKYNGQGVATKSVKELTKLISPTYKYFIADAHVNNIASQRVLEKAGFSKIESLNTGDDKIYYKKRL